jgi:UDP-glucose 4-epimerase
MRVFVTGCAGFLGSHLADAFLARGDQVVGIDNLIGGDLENVPVGVDFYQGDCNEFEKLKKLMRAVEVVVHCAATAHEGLSVFSPHENAMHGYAASASVFSAACAVGVKRIVHCSSMARYGKGDGRLPFTEETPAVPEDPYGIGKFASEYLLKNLCETHGVEAVIAVPHNIHGPAQCYTDPFRNVVSIFANMMLQKRQPIIYGDGLQERSFSYVSDCVDPLVRMATEASVVGETINIGPDTDVISVKRLAEIVASVLDFRLDPVFKPARPREVKVAHCSADKARRLLGYEPKVSLEDGIDRTVSWVKKKGPRPFRYKLDIEIESDLLPKTWAKRLL